MCYGLQARQSFKRSLKSERTWLPEKPPKRSRSCRGEGSVHVFGQRELQRSIAGMVRHIPILFHVRSIRTPCPKSNACLCSCPEPQVSQKAALVSKGLLGNCPTGLAIPGIGGLDGVDPCLSINRKLPPNPHTNPTQLFANGFLGIVRVGHRTGRACTTTQFTVFVAPRMHRTKALRP